MAQILLPEYAVDVSGDKPERVVRLELNVGKVDDLLAMTEIVESAMEKVGNVGSLPLVQAYRQELGAIHKKLMEPVDDGTSSFTAPPRHPAQQAIQDSLF